MTLTLDDLIEPPLFPACTVKRYGSTFPPTVMRPRFRFHRSPTEIRAWWFPRTDDGYALGAGLLRDGGVWVGNGGAGISLLWGAAYRRVARCRRFLMPAVITPKLGLYIGEDF